MQYILGAEEKRSVSSKSMDAVRKYKMIAACGSNAASLALRSALSVALK
jgi:hypothetical protein